MIQDKRESRKPTAFYYLVLEVAQSLILFVISEPVSPAHTQGGWGIDSHLLKGVIPKSLRTYFKTTKRRLFYPSLVTSSIWHLVGAHLTFLIKCVKGYNIRGRASLGSEYGVKDGRDGSWWERF